uniref:Glycosyltransferase family 2 protein n=1 Tax=Anaerolinea thermolimosa TaxID=229919 RepID=A0A7C4KHN4_9CHLR
MVDLSICIVSYNSCNFLKDCLLSLRRQPAVPEMEVIVVDNGSQDGTIAMLHSMFPEVKVIQNEKNLGYTVPMNQALRIAQGRYLVQLNPDTLVGEGAFAAIVEYLEEHPETGVCTLKVLNRDGTLQRQCRRSEARPWDALSYFLGLSRVFPRSRVFGRYLLTYLDDDEIAEVEAVSGSCMIIRREVVEQIGYLDERFFAYQEDTDFCVRARKAGWKVQYVPLGRVVHLGGHGGTRVEVYRSIIAWHRSYELYYRKHLAHQYWFLVNWLVYAAVYLKLGLALLITFFKREKIAGTPKP